MNLEKYTERARGFVQSAQSLALREGHQQFTPEHILKVLLDDEEGLCAGLIDKAGGRSREALDAGRARARASCRRCRARARASSISRRPRRALFDNAEKIAQKAGDAFVTVERLLVALAMEKGAEAGKILANAGVTPQTLNAAINDLRKGRTADSASAENAYDALKKYTRDLTEAARDRQARPGHRPRRGNPPHDAGAVAPHQEQSRADRRARRRQDRHRRGPRAAHRQRRRAGIDPRQEAAVARHGRADRRREISRRVRGAAEGRAQRGDRGRGRHHPVHRRDAHAGRRRQGGRRDGRLQPARSPRWRAANCTASARPRSTNTASTSRRTRRWRGASSRCSSPSRRSRTRSRSCAA